MKVRVLISATLRSFTEHINEFEAEASDIKELLSILSGAYPDIRRVLFDEEENLRDFINIYINDINIRSLKGLSSTLKDNDEVALIPAIAGGSGDTVSDADKSNTKIRPISHIQHESLIDKERYKEIKLDDRQIERYNNHIQLRDISVKGQKRLLAGSVLIAGLGALGGTVLKTLAASGVGTIGLADFDEVKLTNLQTQSIYTIRDVGRPKAAAAKDIIRKLNPDTKINTYQERLTSDNIEEIIEEYDIVVDATDNYVARYLINDACVIFKKPLVFGAMYQFEGLTGVLVGATAPCLRCQFPSPPPSRLIPTCSASGAEAALPGVIGSLMANEVIKLLTGGGNPLTGKLLSFDIWNYTSQLSSIVKDTGCAVCGNHPSITSVREIDYEDFCGLKEDEDEEPIESLEPEEFAKRIASDEKITILDVREPHERSALRVSDSIYIPIGQLARRYKELDPDVDTIIICREGKRSILAIRTLREAGYEGPLYNLRGGLDASKDLIFANEGAWL